ncbi:MAG: hypothetical protein L6R38_009182 [Xanthoria sp. 2 TBL-2021]|nr:MAG: hypothetical protein L6R38_009182 [Xanthoria sp. 2 TBL-2021]
MQQPQTPKTGGAKSSSQGSKSISSNVKNKRDYLTRQNMWFDEEDYDKHEDLKTLVDSILGAKSEMNMRTQSAKNIQKFLHDHATDNEDTLIEPLVDMVIKTNQYAPKHREEVDEMLTETIEHLFTQVIERDLTDDGLGRVRNTAFRQGFVPNQTAEKKIGDPKPDFTWGLIVPTKQEAGQGLAVVESEVDNWIKICPGLQHAFLASQFKGAAKPIEEAENQAIATGAVLVHARRHLNAKAATAKANQTGGQTDQPYLTNKADLDSIAFTIAWVPQMAKLLVHWYEERPGRLGIYHATVVGAYMFAKRTTLKDSLLELRRDIGHVLEWGIYDRKRQVDRVLKDIYPNY